MLIRKCVCGEKVFGLEVFCPNCGKELSKNFLKDPDQKDRDAWDQWVGAFCSKDGHVFQTVNQSFSVNFCANCGEKISSDAEEGDECSDEWHIIQSAGVRMPFNCPQCGHEIDPG